MNVQKPMRALGLVSALAALAAAPLTIVGCGSSDDPPPRARAATTLIQRDTPAPLRGQIGTEASILGIEPSLVSGFGLVVGLNGTGGGELDARIQSTMERQLALMGVGKAGIYPEGSPLEGKTPRQVLRDPNVAVVIVQAAIPPGAPAGYEFDVFVRPINNSATVSLEGGTLWTTELRFGRPAVFGAVQARKVAEARGPIFLNPFADPGSERAPRGVGRVLAGGVVTEPLLIELRTDSPSAQRAREIVAAINSRFPEMPGDGGPIATGRKGGNVRTGEAGSIALRVPYRYSDNPEEFLNLVQYTQIRQDLPQEFSRRYAEALKQQPWLGVELSWSLQAIGREAVPFARDLYDYSEVVPRLAALRAGAKLGDVRAMPALRELAMTAEGRTRVEAIELLGELDAGPQVDLALKELVASRELDVRVAAYEAMLKRATRVQANRMSVDATMVTLPDGRMVSPRELEWLAAANLPKDPMRPVYGGWVAGKFSLHFVPVGEPLIYVTQQGRPRVVVFGENTALNPGLVSIWSDRLMLTTDSESGDIRLYYRDHRTNAVTTQTIKPDLESLIRFFAHTPTPEDPRPGLGFTYSQVVGALYGLSEERGIAAAFSTEQDRLRAQLLRAAGAAEPKDRPETASPNTPAVLDPNYIPGVDDLPPDAPSAAPEPNLKGGPIRDETLPPAGMPN